MIKLSKHLCICAALFSSSAAFASDSGWMISETDGQVSITRDAKALYAAKGTRLEIGDVVSTSEGGRAVLVRGDEFYIVSPKAQVRIKKAEEQGVAAQVFQYIGEKVLGMERKAKGTPGTKEPVLAAVVKGYGDKPEKPELKDFEGTAHTLNPSE